MRRYGNLGRQILQWYTENKRDLPWRKTKDPYRIWISEMMLQQTRVDTVIDYYERFLRRFPDIYALAEAGEDDVLAVWQGLGYYSRARNLHRAAKLMEECFDGKFPDAYEELRKLPGIGDYSAGAILSIAFGQPYAAVDGNVLRVVARLEEMEEDIGLGKTKKTVREIVTQMIPPENPGDFTQGLMELGALVCIPTEPHCTRCPVQALCRARQSGRQHEIPNRKKRDKPVPEFFYRAAVICHQGFILMEYRAGETLLSRMWGVPMVETNEALPPEVQFAEVYGLQLKPEKNLGEVTHVFTHRIWRMDAALYSIDVSRTPDAAPLSLGLQAPADIQIPENIPMPANCRWIKEERLKNLAVPTAFQKILGLLQQPGEGKRR